MLLLAFVLIVANVLAPWSVAASAEAMTHSGSTHHCHDTAAGKTAHQHGKASLCCGAGCFCLHGSAAPLPEFAVLPAPLPLPLIVPRSWAVPPSPALAEQLRPPIA